MRATKDEGGEMRDEVKARKKRIGAIPSFIPTPSSLVALIP
jgi:hypothetical protein